MKLLDSVRQSLMYSLYHIVYGSPVFLPCCGEVTRTPTWFKGGATAPKTTTARWSKNL